MQVSVAIPTYNGMNYLREAVESVFAQTHPADEIIIVDDGSTDGTAELCAQWGARVRYIYQENDGSLGGTARARAIAEARGEWIALLDHDDRWLPRKLEVQLEAGRMYPQARAIVVAVRQIDQYGDKIIAARPVERSGSVVELSPRDAFHLLLGENPFAASAGMVQRSFVMQHGLTPVSELGVGDWDLWLSVARSYPIVMIDEVLAEYRVSPTQFGSNRERLGKLQQRTLYQQRPHLHPNCRVCERRFRDGQAVTRGFYQMAARNHLDECHALLRAGNLPAARRSLRRAIRISPLEVARPRRALAVAKNYLRAALLQRSNARP